MPLRRSCFGAPNNNAIACWKSSDMPPGILSTVDFRTAANVHHAFSHCNSWAAHSNHDQCNALMRRSFRHARAVPGVIPSEYRHNRNRLPCAFMKHEMTAGRKVIPESRQRSMPMDSENTPLLSHHPRAQPLSALSISQKV